MCEVASRLSMNKVFLNVFYMGFPFSCLWILV